jgi:hypothetical protein
MEPSRRRDVKESNKRLLCLRECRSVNLPQEARLALYAITQKYDPYNTGICSADMERIAVTPSG